MKVFILKPKIGQTIKARKLGVTGKVVDFISYQEATDGMIDSRLKKFNAELELRLGEDFRDLYYEAIIKVTRGSKKSGYKKGDLAIVGWEDLQDLTAYGKV